MKTFISLFLLMPLLTFAEEPNYKVEVDPSVYPSASFDGKGVKTGTIPTRIKREDALPNKADREKVFARVPGLDTDISKMDELDRDMFFVRAKTRALEELKKLYPMIAPNKLALLKKELK